MAIGADIGNWPKPDYSRRCGTCQWFDWRTRDHQEKLVGDCTWPVPLAYCVIRRDRRDVHEDEVGCPCFKGKQL